MWYSLCSQRPRNPLRVFCGISVNLQSFCKNMQLKLRQTSTHKTARGKCTHVHSLSLLPIIWAICNCRPYPAKTTKSHVQMMTLNRNLVYPTPAAAKLHFPLLKDFLWHHSNPVIFLRYELQVKRSQLVWRMGGFTRLTRAAFKLAPDQILLICLGFHNSGWPFP